MYYSLECTDCGKVFYTYGDDKELASQALYKGIEEHMKEFNEEEDSSFYHDAEEDTNRIYSELKESAEAPSGGYEI